MNFLDMRGKDAWDYGKQKLDSGEWTFKEFTQQMTDWCKLNRKAQDVRFIQQVFEVET